MEVALAAMAKDREELINESADLLYHLTVLLQNEGLSLKDVVQRLHERHQVIIEFCSTKRALCLFHFMIVPSPGMAGPAPPSADTGPEAHVDRVMVKQGQVLPCHVVVQPLLAVGFHQRLAGAITTSA